MPDGNSIAAAKRTVGRAFALFELPLGTVAIEEIQRIIRELLTCGAGIEKISIVRKHLPAVQGDIGRPD